MRQHPRPTYGKARGQWPPQLDKGDSSAQFHGQMESARRLSLTVEFSAPLRCVWQRVSLAREIFFMQGMKNGTECTLSRENETLPGAKPDSERNRYDPCTTERRRRPRRPPKRAGREKGGAKNTDLPFRRSAWYIYMVVQDSRTRRARPLQLCPTQCNSPGSRRGGQTSLLVCSLPSHGLTHNGGLSSRRLAPLRCILALTVPVAWAKCLVHLSRCLINARSARKLPLKCRRFEPLMSSFSVVPNVDLCSNRLHRIADIYF